MSRKFFSLVFTIFLFFSIANAQTAEVTVSLNEQFFDSLLDAIFKNFDAPEFPLTAKNSEFRTLNSKLVKTGFQSIQRVKYFNDESGIWSLESGICNESIRLQREIDGVRTAVRFRDGKIYTPLAFSGSYNPPLIGCVDFQGFAETNIDLEYDKQTQKLVGRVRVLNVQLSGTNGIGSSLITKFVQNSIDKRINPLEILQADKLSFVVPIKNASLKMKATGIRYEITNGALNVHIAYEFVKG